MPFTPETARKAAETRRINRANAAVKSNGGPRPDPTPALSWPLPDRNDWTGMSLDDVHALIQKLQAAYQEGAVILNQRVSDTARESGKYTCMVCRKVKPQTINEHPNYVWRDDRRDPATGIYTTKLICSQECFFRGSNSGKLTNAGVPANVHK